MTWCWTNRCGQTGNLLAKATLPWSLVQLATICQAMLCCLPPVCTILPMSTLYRAQVTLWIQLIRSNSHDKSSTLLFFKTSTHMYNVNLYLFYSTDEYWRKSVKKINVPLTLVGFLFLPLEQMKVKSSS